MSFETWMREVDLFVRDTVGLSVGDLPDWPFRADYDAGWEPEEIALKLLASEGLVR